MSTASCHPVTIVTPTWSSRTTGHFLRIASKYGYGSSTSRSSRKKLISVRSATVHCSVRRSLPVRMLLSLLSITFPQPVPHVNVDPAYRLRVALRGGGCAGLPGAPTAHGFNRRSVAAVGESDVEAAQVGLQPGVLDGDQMRGGAGFVEVRVPHPRWRDERATGLPIHPDRGADLAVG